MKQWYASKRGACAEQYAKQYLIDKGLYFVAENYRVKVGEIDLIFKDHEQWVFVEVKYRENNTHGSAAEMFTTGKRRKLTRAIMCYLQSHDLNFHHTHMRIDLFAIDGDEVNWIKNV
ncbi:YraN family protein [Glaciecola sp. XM2]|uniref:YraN family protein n=1 Tax=Glaciecola sp. XM2 TaxID=1914931 RepID=UPI001BDF67A9|nr:YraN family protein [Glaciecola sp. XM2]MBT1451083.1 YraN family protein [Glaciecola sp. XM2]